MTSTLVIDVEAFDGDEVEVAGDAYRHLFRARRLARGERVRVVDGRGRARWSEIGEVRRDRAVLALAEAAPANEPERRLELVVAALRPERAAWLVEKATEIGVRAVRFVGSERTPRRYGGGQLERWRRVAVAAVEQCQRAWVPEISGVHGWDEVAGLLAGAEARRFLDFGGDPLRPEGSSGALLVGPEGGWSDEERHALAGLGAAPAGLGSRVLRVETAALVAAARWLLF